MTRRCSTPLTFVMTALFLACLLTLTPTAHAVGWRMATGGLANEILDRLSERHPDIESAQDLENLIAEIGRRHQMKRIEVKLENGVWVIYAEKAEIVTDLEIDIISAQLKANIHNSTQNFIGQVDTSSTGEHIKSIALKHMKKRGYPEATASINRSVVGNNISYSLKINEQSPSVIEKFEFGFRMPSDVTFTSKPGEICDEEQILTSISKLETDVRSRGYNQVKMELANITYDQAADLCKVYISGILGQKVRYQVIDVNKRFLIDDLFGDEELTGVDPTIISPDAMSAELARRYRNKGFSDVSVKGPDVQKSGDDEFVYVFTVDPGKQYFLQSIDFEGNTIFKEEELLDAMGMERGSKPINYEEIQSGVNGIRGKYQQAGYWEARIRDPGIGQKDKESGTVRLTIQIQEGLQRLLSSVTISGNKFLNTEEIKEMVKLVDGEPLDRALLIDIQQRITSTYISNGFLYADVTVEIKPTEAKRAIIIDLVLTIREGPRVKIGDITVVGLTRTQEKVVRRELLFETGDWYSPEKRDRSRQILTRLGLFRSVQIGPADRQAIQNKEKVIDILVDTREGKAGNVAFGPGWSLAKGWNYGAEASYNNFGGLGRQASLRGSISEEKDQEAIGNKTLVGRKIGTGYVEPYVFDYPFDVHVNASQKAEWGADLWELSYGGEIALVHKFRNSPFLESRISTFYGQKVAKTEGSIAKEADQLASDVRIGSTGVRYSIDDRNNLKFPTSGYTLETELAWARYELGGDLRYFRWDISTGFFHGITDTLVFAIGLNLTSYEGVQRKGDKIGILPPSERLFSGGAETVRGYRTRTLGPIVRSPKAEKKNVAVINGQETDVCNISYTDSYLDGTRRTNIKTELRHMMTDSFALTGFVDNGTVFLSRDQFKKFASAYETPVDLNADGQHPECGDIPVRRSIEDNIGYEYHELYNEPGRLWAQHYYSYGASLNFLTAIGSINLAYGLPWREPKTEKCSENSADCNPRGKNNEHWLQRGEFHLNVGARF
jgi:outer membrane protein assembly complex protein YaeT